MGKEPQKTSSYTLPKEEIEKMLLDAHGSKLQPVSDEKMARQRQAQARYEEKREKAQAEAEDDAKAQGPDTQSDPGL